MAVRDDVTAPPFIPEFCHIVHQSGRRLPAGNPAVVTGPMEDLVTLAAVRPAPRRRTTLLQRGVELADKSLDRGDAVERLVPSRVARHRRRPGAVDDDHGFLRPP